MLAVLLWLVAAGMELLSAEATNGLANLAAIWLLTVGVVAFLLGVLLQLASLRVAKLRGEAISLAAKDAEATSGLGGIASALADMLKSAKVPVAAMLLGAILMVTGGVVAMESSGVAADDQDIEHDLVEELERNREEIGGELQGFERLIGELCQRLERSDIVPRRLGDLGELLVEVCG